MNKDNLAGAAMKLDALYKKYTPQYEQARVVYESCKPLLEKAMNKKIDTAIPAGWFHIYLEPGYDLANIDDLSQAAAEFSILLKGWNSIEDFRHNTIKLRKIHHAPSPAGGRGLGRV